ncbi:hypothetical protein ACN28E_40070 [Archangium lansingense]|uniref:hypothetical protein n=1 Tax=Archangium lansingense TaxID=2995310 RepID=UPI003B7D6982
MSLVGVAAAAMWPSPRCKQPDDPKLLEAAIEETVRFTSPVRWSSSGTGQSEGWRAVSLPEKRPGAPSP